MSHLLYIKVALSAEALVPSFLHIKSFVAVAICFSSRKITWDAVCVCSGV